MVINDRINKKKSRWIHNENSLNIPFATMLHELILLHSKNQFNMPLNLNGHFKTKLWKVIAF